MDKFLIILLIIIIFILVIYFSSLKKNTENFNSNSLKQVEKRQQKEEATNIIIEAQNNKKNYIYTPLVVDKITKMSMFIPNYVKNYCDNNTDLMATTILNKLGFCESKSTLKEGQNVSYPFSINPDNGISKSFDSCKDQCLKDINCKSFTYKDGKCTTSNIDSLDMPLIQKNENDVSKTKYYEKMDNTNQSRFNNSFLNKVELGKIDINKKTFILNEQSGQYENPTPVNANNPVASEYMEFSNVVLDYNPMQDINQQKMAFQTNYVPECISFCENKNGCVGVNYNEPGSIFYPEVNINKATFGQNCLKPKPEYNLIQEVKNDISKMCSEEESKHLCAPKPDYKKFTNCNDKSIIVSYKCNEKNRLGDSIKSEEKKINITKNGDKITYNDIIKNQQVPSTGLDCRKPLSNRLEIMGVSYGDNLSNYIKTNKLQTLCKDSNYGTQSGCGPYSFDQLFTPDDDPSPLCKNKVLEVEYTCNGIAKKKTFKKNKNFQIDCPATSDGKSNLIITSAIYGRSCETNLNNLNVINTLTQISKEANIDLNTYLKSPACSSNNGLSSKNKCTYTIDDNNYDYFKEKLAQLKTQDKTTPVDRSGNIKVLKADYGGNCSTISGFNPTQVSDLQNLSNLCDNKTQCIINNFVPMTDPLVDPCKEAASKPFVKAINGQNNDGSIGKSCKTNCLLPTSQLGVSDSVGSIGNKLNSPVSFGPIRDDKRYNINLPLNTMISKLVINYTGSDQAWGNRPEMIIEANGIRLGSWQVVETSARRLESRSVTINLNPALKLTTPLSIYVPLYPGMSVNIENGFIHLNSIVGGDISVKNLDSNNICNIM